MPYAVVVPGISTVYERWSDVQRIIALYPYPKFRKFKTAEECWDFVKRNTYKRVYTDVVKYGDTFSELCVEMQYFIRHGAVYYNFKPKKTGYLALDCEDDSVEVINRINNIKVKMSNIELNDELITSHMIAIWHGLRIVGDFVDVNIIVPDHSIFYALMTYTGKNKIITRVRSYIDDRLANVSVTLKGFGDG